MDGNDYLNAIALCLVQGIGIVLGKRLIDEYGSASAVMQLKKQELKKIPNLKASVIDQIVNGVALEKAEKELAFVQKHNITLSFYKDDNYPKRLKECADSPVLIAMKGNAEVEQRKTVSIVGTRKASKYGCEFVQNLCEELVPHNATIISGLAHGIDYTAHQAALKHNLPTFAVMGHGFDIIYPASHRELARDICSNGLLMTEFFTQSPKDRSNFIRRNRIIAGLSDAIVVVESDVKGGAMNTARYGNDYNRDVFALPGNIDRKESKGCNYLIKNHKAVLIESVSDLEYYLNWDGESKPQQQILFPDLQGNEKRVVDCLSSSDGIQLDEIGRELNLSVSEVTQNLFSLEMKNVVRVLPGNRYVLI